MSSFSTYRHTRNIAGICIQLPSRGCAHVSGQLLSIRRYARKLTASQHSKKLETSCFSDKLKQACWIGQRLWLQHPCMCDRNLRARAGGTALLNGPNVPGQQPHRGAKAGPGTARSSAGHWRPQTSVSLADKDCWCRGASKVWIAAAAACVRPAMHAMRLAACTDYRIAAAAA